MQCFTQIRLHPRRMVWFLFSLTGKGMAKTLVKAVRYEVVVLKRSEY